MKAIATLLALAMVGCANTQVNGDPQIVFKPCMGKRPERPVYVFPTLPKPKTEAEAASAVKALWLDFDAADTYGRKLESAASGCQ